MRVPISWLSEYVDVVPGSGIDDIHAALVKVGLEEEGSHRFEVSGPVVVGQVLDVVPEPQSNGKTIRWCQVRVAPEGQPAADGGADVRGIVCGASNFEVGDKVVVTLPGAVLPGEFFIAARKTYGHVSDGMIASARELGLGEDHAGILRLATLGLDPEVGTDAIALLHLDDAAVEVNVTPDRGYAFSIRGIAREYAHATGAAFRDPAASAADDGEGDSADEFPVRIQDDAPLRGRVGASVFVTRAVSGVDPTRPTPPWMIARLKLAGIRSISIAVDITNYVMLELGQPIHAYDLDTLTGGITVRRAAPGERLVTLDGQERILDPEDLVIADESGAIGLAGVMGGASTEIGDATRNVLVEAANFDPVSIARTARRHKLPSEASRRFERGVDPEVAVAAAARVVQLLVDLAGGRVEPLGSAHHSHARPADILLPDGYIAGLIGVDYTDDEIRTSLAEIGATLTPTAGGLLVTPPTWRPDLTHKSTLAEEVARIVGYDRIPSVLPVAPPGRGLTNEQQLRRTTGTVLAASGYTEVIAYPFITPDENATFGSADGSAPAAISLANALDAQIALLRTSLLPGLVHTAQRNLSRGFADLALFEIGTVFLPEEGREYGTDSIPLGAVRPGADELAAIAASLPAQPTRIGMLQLGALAPRQSGLTPTPVGLADVVDGIRTLADALQVPLRLRAAGRPSLHPGRSAEVVAGLAGDEFVIGYAGELLPELALSLDLPRVVAVAELDLDGLLRYSGRGTHVEALSTYPAATQDVSILVPLDAPAADVGAAIREGAGDLLEDLVLVDDYRGQGIEEGRKSLSFALRFRAPDRTLTAADASAAKDAGVAVAAERFGAHLRE